MIQLSISASIRRFIAAAPALLAVPLLSQTPPDLDTLLRGVEARLAAGFTYKNWTAAATTKVTETDKKGNPEKVTAVTKTVRVKNGERDEDILKAVETEDGKATDITRKYAEEQRKRRDKERKRREEEAKKSGGKAGRRGGSFDLDEIMPFSAAKRALYDFTLRPAEDGRPLVILEARAKVKSDKAWDGVYTIDPAAFDIVKAEVRPSKNPRFVKELWAEADIEAIAGKHLFITRTKFRIDGGIFIKHVRMIVEDAYTDVRILD
jgi:hypothetical protein